MFQGQAENRYQAQDGWPGFFFLDTDWTAEYLIWHKL